MDDRETLIRLEEKVDTILERLKDVTKIEERVRALENVAHGIPEMKGDIKALESKSNTWSIINSVGVFVAGLFGVIGK